MFRFWAVLDRRQRYHFGGLLVVFIINAVFEFLSLGMVFALAIAVLAPHDGFTAQRSLDHLFGPNFLTSPDARATLVVAVVVAFLLKSGIGIVTTWARASIIHKQYTIFAERLMRNYLAKDWTFFLQSNVAVLTSEITGTCRELIDSFINGTAVIATELCVCLALFAGLAYISPVAMLVLGGAMVALIGALHLGLRRGMYRLGYNAWATRTNAARTIKTALHGAKEVILYQCADAFCNELHADLQRQGRAAALAQTLYESPRQIIEFSAVAGFVGFLAVEAMTGHSMASVGVLASVFATAGFRLLPSASRIASAASGISNTRPSFEMLLPDLTVAPVPRVAPAPPPIKFTQAIEVNSVRYRYPEASSDALQGISFRIPKGRSVGIVGRSGAGKTTLMELLLAVLAPTEGEILIDDRPLDASTRAAWQSGIGYVPQLIFLSDDTLARNIAFGVPASEIDLDRVREAARLANIAQFIEEETTDGYQTTVGEGGIKLSGGQRQRVVIARALYRGPQVLVFDEATSALDSVTETAVNDAIARLQGEQTILIIAHRLSSVRHCSDILVLDHGRLVQRGSFDALTNKAGVFQSMAAGVGSVA